MCHGQMLNEALRNAQKPHVCTECGKPIPKGRKHYYQTAIIDGEFQTMRTHTRCAAVLDATAWKEGECSISGESHETLEGVAVLDGWRAARKFATDALVSLRARLDRPRGRR